MQVISDFCDQAACFLIDPLNQQFSPDTQRIACVMTVLIGILTLGMAQAVSALWRNLRPIEEENETHVVIGELFRNVFGGNKIPEEEEEDEWFPESPSSPSQTDNISPFDISPPDVKEDPVLEAEETSPEELLRQFSSAELVTLRSALLMKNEMIIDLGKGEEYVLTYQSDSSTLTIQERESYNNHVEDKKLEMVIDQDGKITSLQIHQRTQADHSEAVSENFAHRLLAGLNAAIERIYQETSKYMPGWYKIYITTVKRSVKRSPDFHLRKLLEAIEKSRKAGAEVLRLNVTFLNDHLELNEGLDADGISRDFLDDLFEGIIQNSTLSFKPIEGSSLMLPQTKKGAKNCRGLPLLDAEEKSLCRDMGKLMREIYLKNKIVNHLKVNIRSAAGLMRRCSMQRFV